RGGSDDRRLHPDADHPEDRPATGAAGHHRHRHVRVHDRVERVPLRAALPRRPARQLDRLPGHRPALGLRGAAHGAHGRVDGDDHPDRHRLRGRPASPALRTHGRCGEGMSTVTAHGRERTTTVSRPWWTDAVVYEVYLRSFADSDGDGVGDLAGVTARLDHLAELGVDAVWITPFFPSPGHD